MKVELIAKHLPINSLTIKVDLLVSMKLLDGFLEVAIESRILGPRIAILLIAVYLIGFTLCTYITMVPSL